MEGHAPVPISPSSPDTATLSSRQSVAQSTPPTSLDSMVSNLSIMKQPTSPPSNGQPWAGPSPPRVRISSAQPIARPSPLSRRADGSMPDIRASDDLLNVSGNTQRTPNSIRQGSSPRGVDAGSYEPSPKSPCFIHSHLEKHGQLSEWLRLKTETASSSRQGGSGHQCNDECAAATDDAGHARLMTPSRSILGQAGPSSQREHISCTDDVSDAEDGGGSLTRQLAETATGVREMSKQLGEFGRRAVLLTRPEDARRSHACALQHSTRPHRHQSSGQSADQADSRAGHLPHDPQARWQPG